LFDKLRKAFFNAARNISQKEIADKDLDKNLVDLQLELIESDVAQDVIDDLFVRLKKELLGTKIEKGQTAEAIIKSNIQKTILEMFSKAGEIDLVNQIKSYRQQSKSSPFIIVFLGINGTGKTTTIAKVAYMLRKSGISVVLAAGDTHRAGAIEQLSQHAGNLSIKVIAQRYGADPSSVARDAVEYSKKHYIDAVLIDTAGRMQTAKNLMEEISKIIRVVKPHMKLFIGDSLAGNDTIQQAKEFFRFTNFDAAILTKVDADAKGGAAISIVHSTSKPIVCLGVGQGYNDIISFNYEKFIASLLGNDQILNIEKQDGTEKNAETYINSERPTHDFQYLIERQEPLPSEIKFLKIKDQPQPVHSEDTKKTIYNESNASEPNDISYPKIESNDGVDRELKYALENTQEKSNNLSSLKTDHQESQLVKERKSIFSGLFGRKANKGSSTD
jgi:fused signal recognition particle receptor